MPGRMGNKTRTVQNLQVMKIDTTHNLIYVKGAVPGVDDQYVRVTDAIKKGWHQKTFPDPKAVPFPTFMGKAEQRELLMPSQFGTITDPFSRTKREKP